MAKQQNIWTLIAVTAIIALVIGGFLGYGQGQRDTRKALSIQFSEIKTSTGTSLGNAIRAGGADECGCSCPFGICSGVYHGGDDTGSSCSKSCASGSS